MKLLLDMNLSRRWVAPLISLGHDRSTDLRVQTALQQVAESLVTAAEALAAGALVSIDMRRARIRLLALRPIG